MEEYKKIREGHIYQTKKTGDIPTYSTEYMNYYDRIPSQNMSALRYKLIEQYVPEFNSVCDFGFGNGSFISYCKNKEKVCYAYDISDYPAPDGVERVSDIDSVSVDVMTFFDSLEHFHDINFVKDLKCKYVLISVPCCHYYSDEWFENWKHRRPDEHIFHFNDDSLNKFMIDCGFEKMSISFFEDTIRKGEEKNILTGIFKKI